MQRFVWFFVLGLVLLPQITDANELVFGADAMTTYDDNVFNRAHKEEDDVSFLFGPHLEFRSDPGDLSYSVSYNPLYEAFVDTNDTNGWRHRMQGQLSYRPNARTAFYVSENFSIAPYILQGLELSSDSAVSSDPALEATREDVKRNHFDAGFEHFLTPRTRLNINLRTGLLDAQDGSTRIANQESYSVGGSLTRAMTKRDKLSFGVEIGHQEFQGIREQHDSDEQTYYLYGGWEHQWSRDLALSLRAGPAFIKNDSRPETSVPTYGITLNDDGSISARTTTGCRPGPGGTLYAAGCETRTITMASSPAEYAALRPLVTSKTKGTGLYSKPSVDDTTTTLFAELEFIKRWERSSLGFHYLRSTSAQHLVGFESSTIQDMVEIQGRHQFTKRLGGVMTLTWNQYESSTDLGAPTVLGDNLSGYTIDGFPVYRVIDVAYQDVDQRIDVETIRAAFSLRYQIDRRSTLSFGSSYLYRTSETSFLSSGSGGQLRSDIFRVWLGYTFRFEPIDI